MDKDTIIFRKLVLQALGELIVMVSDMTWKTAGKSRVSYAEPKIRREIEYLEKKLKGE